jgi:diguanylate cyclase (GGDEF)-like protein/PAS domain S-box-containing protein
MTAPVGTITPTDAPNLTEQAAPMVRLAVGLSLGIGLGLALASVGSDIWIRTHGPGESAIVPRSLAAFAVLWGAVGVVASMLERRRRDLPRRQGAFALMASGLLCWYGGQVIGYAITAPSDGTFPAMVESVPLTVGAPLVIVGLVSVCWPPGMTRRDIWFVASDGILAAAALSVFWALVVLPAEAPGGSLVDSVFQSLDPWVQYLTVVALVVSASASRRPGGLPVAQMILLQCAVGVYIASDIIGDVSPEFDRVTVVTWSIVGYLSAAIVLWRFALRPALEPEPPASTRVRDEWSIAIPFVPVVMAAGGMIITRLTSGPLTSGVLGLAIVGLVIVVTSNLLTRQFLARDSRALDRQPLGLQEGTKSEWFAALVGDARDLVTVVDHHGVIAYQTPSVTPVLGYPPEVLVGQSFADLLLDRSRSEISALLVRASHDDGDRGPHEFMMVDAHGARHYAETRIAPLRTGGSDGFVLTTRDVTDRRRLREALAESGTRDRLTGLLNREGFLTRLREEMTPAAADSLAVALFDLDAFRDLNDSLGHQSGDEVLRAVAGLLERLPRDVRAVGRTGADEFGLVIVADPVEQTVGDTQRSLRESLNRVILQNGRALSVKFSFGYVTFSGGFEVASQLMEDADLALAAARTGQAGAVVRYESDLRAALVARLRAEAELRTALDEDRLLVHYQPIVALRDGQVQSFEALVRMRSPDGGIVAPDQFVPLAEDLGLIHRIGETVLKRALSDRWAIAAALGRPVTVSVNVSPQQLDEQLVDTVASALAATATPAEMLVLELTETAKAEDQEESRHRMADLRELGCAVALDDFGTGYSSLSYLAELPVDQLKVDRSFVGNLGSSPTSFALVRMVLQLAQTMGLITIAEGVETIEQADILRGMNCDRVQGYLLAPPMSLPDFLMTLDVGGGVLPVALG